MDIAAMSVVMSNHQVRNQASLAVMGNIMDVMKQQGGQITDMLESTGTSVPHPTLGNQIDIKR